jgi:hypothetical protein
MEYTTSVTIETDDGKYKLCAIIVNNIPCSPWLEVPEDTDEDLYWENSTWLLNTLYPSLAGKRKRKKYNITDNTYELIPKDRRKEVRGIIKQGIKMGFFNEENRNVLNSNLCK